MQRVRSRLRLCAWLALFALAFQLVASFGHVHGVKDTEYRLAQLIGAAPTNANIPSGNANDQTPDRDDDFCAVCALIHLAGAIVVAEPPTLALPAALEATRITYVPSEFEIIPASQAEFSARAPPGA
jgi:hypothetical protein